MYKSPRSFNGKLAVHSFFSRLHPRSKHVISTVRRSREEVSRRKGKMKKEFDPLALDGHNFPTWSVDLKVSLSLRGFYGAIVPPQEGTTEPDTKTKYSALYIIRAHIHPDLKSEYLM